MNMSAQRQRIMTFLLPDGSVVQLPEGARITGSKIIAGQGRDRQIHGIDGPAIKYGKNPALWQKAKEIGYVAFEGEEFNVESHWYQEHERKLQRGGNWFIDEDSVHKR